MIEPHFDPDGLVRDEMFGDMLGTTFWSKWFGGVIAPAVLAVVGLVCCVTRRAAMERSGTQWELVGGKAVLCGVAAICLAFYLHFTCFWPHLKRLGGLAPAGAALSLLGFIASFGYVVWSMLLR